MTGISTLRGPRPPRLVVMRDEREIVDRAPPARPARHDRSPSTIRDLAAPVRSVDVIVLDADPCRSGRHRRDLEARHADHRTDRHRDPEPVEMAARSAAGLVPGQAAALGRTLHRAGGGVRHRAAASTMKAPASNGSSKACAPAASCSPPCFRSCAVTRCPSGRLRADPANRHAASHDDRTIMRRHHRRRRHAETDQPYRVTTAPVSRVP